MLWIRSTACKGCVRSMHALIGQSVSSSYELCVVGFSCSRRSLWKLEHPHCPSHVWTCHESLFKSSFISHKHFLPMFLFCLADKFMFTSLPFNLCAFLVFLPTSHKRMAQFFLHSDFPCVSKMLKLACGVLLACVCTCMHGQKYLMDT